MTTIRPRAGRPAALAPLAAALALVGLAAPPAQASYSEADGVLTPRLAQLARPALRDASEARQARATGLPAEGPGSLEREGGRLVVEVRFSHGALARLDDLRAMGAEVLASSSRYQAATVVLRPAALPALGDVPGVLAADEALAPVSAAAPCQGAVVSEGDTQLGAAPARADFGLDGGGVTVGVISDSFADDSGAATTAPGDVLSGDLPGTANPCGNTTPVGILSEFTGPGEGTDEGRAMAQIVHDMAPGAAIDFATAENTELDFAEHIEDLAAAGAGVIVDDISYFGEPFFQDGPVAVAIEKAVGEGVVYLTSAGNDNTEDSEGHRIGSWETREFRDSPGCPPKLEALAPEGLDSCLDFDPGPGVDEAFAISVQPKSELIVDVQWAEPWFGVEADLDAYLLDSGGEPIPPTSAGTENNIGQGKPVEELFFENETATTKTIQIAINRCFSTEKQQEEEKGGCNPFADDSRKPRVKMILAQNGTGVSATEYPESTPPDDIVGPTVYGHAGAPGAIAVAAVPASNSGIAERYTSRGPVTHYFGPVDSASVPAPELGSPEVIAKPDLAASDCVKTTFFVPTATPNLFRFCGTSASAPHAAGVVALARQANPSASPEQVRAGLLGTAKPVGEKFGPDAVGAGLIDAYGAIDEIALPPKISFPGLASIVNDASPQIAFAANRPVTFSCGLDRAPLRPCSSPFIPEEPLFDGPHELDVRGIDLSGRLGQGTAHFTVDTVAPRTFFRAKPRRNLRTRARRVRATFRFGSNDPSARFICRVDGGLYYFCPEVVSRRFAAGVHVIRVKATDPAGNVDRSAASFRFRVRRVGSR